MENERELISRCLLRDKSAERELYQRLSGAMFGICLRYLKTTHDAEDALQDGFIAVFRNLHKYRFEGSFEGWVRKTIIRSAVNICYRQARHQRHRDLTPLEEKVSSTDDVFAKLSADELLGLIRELPPGYRMVFNLSVIDGYSHAEIGEMLGVSEETSKSQLFRARQSLRALLAMRSQYGLSRGIIK